jgi:hypothetical protein
MVIGYFYMFLHIAMICTARKLSVEVLPRHKRWYHRPQKSIMQPYIDAECHTVTKLL